MSKDKKKHGGAGRGQGRKPKSQTYGARIKTAITLRSDHFENLADKNRSEYIDAGLEVVQYALGNTPGTDACLITYYAICNSIERLERRRDYNAEGIDDGEFHWTKEEENLHTLLYDFWERIRREALFKEDKLPD